MLRTYGLPPPIAFAQDAAPVAVEPGIFELMATVRAPKSSPAWSTPSPVTAKSNYQPPPLESADSRFSAVLIDSPRPQAAAARDDTGCARPGRPVRRPGAVVINGIHRLLGR